MGLVTLEEMKERLSADFSTKDTEIQGLINSAEGYLLLATGVDYSKIEGDDPVKNVAKEWVFLRVYLDYYIAHTEIDEKRLTAMMKQLQVRKVTYGSQSS